jgi:phosphotransferase system HPr (HPr) family protein
MIERVLVVKASLGLHARAAAKLVRIASRFESKMSLERVDGATSADGAHRVDAKSILSVLMLAATQGTELRAIAEGPDETEAMTALVTGFSEGFGELQ